MVKVLAAMLIICAALFQSANMWAAQGAAAPAAWLATVIRLPFERRFLATAAVARLEENPRPATLSQTQSLVDGLAATPDGDALRARIAVVRGDHELAFETALRARQMNIVDDEIDRLTHAGAGGEALRRERLIVSTLNGEPAQREALADAYWRLGDLENRAAESGDPQLHRMLARDAFEADVALTPLSGRALISAAYAELALHNTDKAKQLFMSALASDPASASADVGLARVALTHHERRQAHVFAGKAYALAPDQSDVRRLQTDLR